MEPEDKNKNKSTANDVEKKDPVQTGESMIAKIEKEKEVPGGNPDGNDKKNEEKKEEPKDSSKDEKPGEKKENDKKKDTEVKGKDKKDKQIKPKSGTPPAPSITNTGLIRLQKKKNKTINIIIISFFTLLAILIFITIISVRYFMARQKLNKRAAENSAITKVVEESPLKPHFMAMSEKINKLPESKMDIDANIATLQAFVDKYSPSAPTDEWVKQAREQIKAQEDLKMMY